MHYEMIDIRDRIREFEKENRFWPRSGSVSKPYFYGRTEQEEYYCHHQWSLVPDPEDGSFQLRMMNES